LAGLQFTAVFDVIAFCKSSTVTLYIFAMDVSVSPRATVCALPSTEGCDGDARRAAGDAGAGAASPIITPGRACEQLLLQFENLLRKRVDLGVLFVNLFCQSFKLRGLRRFSFVRTGLSAEAGPKRERAYCAENDDSLSSQRNFATETFV
jgi:hypothetical protein